MTASIFVLKRWHDLCNASLSILANAASIVAWKNVTLGCLDLLVSFNDVPLVVIHQIQI